jgi:large repetitive protein
MALDALVTGSIASPGQVDRFTFSVTERTRVVFDSQTNRNFAWSLVGPRGTVSSGRTLQNADSVDFGSTTPVLDLAAGDYTLAIDAPGDDIGDYAFRLRDLASATLVTPVSP